MRKGLMRQLMQNALAMAVTILAGNWAVHYAYEYRGYAAAGGEYLFIPVVYLGVSVGCGWFLDILKKIRWHRNVEKYMSGPQAVNSNKELVQPDHDDKVDY